MTTLYIIGNGFDLNLGLKTSYIDFMYSDEFKSNSGNNLFEYLSKVKKSSKWVDIEAELVNYSNHRDSHREFLCDYKILCKCLQEYIKTIDVNEIDTNSAAFRLFSKISFKDDFKIINFNYTDSVLSVLKKNSNHDLSSRVFNIHGKANEQIIFGIDENARINKEDSFLYKATSKIFNPKISRDLLSNFDTIHIFGHSLGESDEIYFDFFNRIKFQRSGGKEINIYHYGEAAMISLYSRIHSLTNGGISLLKTHNEFKSIDVMQSVCID